MKFDQFKNKDVILKGYSALEYAGYCNQELIEVYSLSEIEGCDCCIVDNFDNIDYTIEDGLKVSSIPQAINDRLKVNSSYDDDALPLVLTNYFSKHGSFKGMNTNPEYADTFRYYEGWAICEYKG